MDKFVCLVVRRLSGGETRLGPLCWRQRGRSGPGSWFPALHSSPLGGTTGPAPDHHLPLNNLSFNLISRIMQFHISAGQTLECQSKNDFCFTFHPVLSLNFIGRVSPGSPALRSRTPWDSAGLHIRPEGLFLCSAAFSFSGYFSGLAFQEVKEHMSGASGSAQRFQSGLSCLAPLQILLLHFSLTLTPPLLTLGPSECQGTGSFIKSFQEVHQVPGCGTVNSATLIH